MSISDRPLTLNVGGTQFTTSRATLLKVQSKFGAIVEQNKTNLYDGPIFLDRDPLHFRLILNYLRNGKIDISSKNQQELQEILEEAEFFELSGLIELCRSQLKGSKGYLKVNHTSELFDVLMDAKKDVVVFKISTDDAATIVFPYNTTDLQRFVDKYKERCQVVLFLLKTMSSYEWEVEYYPIKKTPSRPGAEGFPDFYEEFDNSDHRY